MPKLKTNVTSTPPNTAPITPATVKPADIGAAKKVKATADVNAPLMDTAAIHKTGAVAKTTVPGIPEAFPIDSLSKIEGKGVSGQTFMLDGGSLRGLKLQIRRVMDGDKPGFELMFQMTQDKLGGVIERVKEKSPATGAISFRGIALNEQGIAKYLDTNASISYGYTHTPTDTDSTATNWSLSTTDAKGAQISVATDKAALALRGLVRIDLRGDDKQCTEQLKSVVNSLGLQNLFAPPTPATKQVNMLMRVLWQADHAAAKEISKEGLDKVKVADLEAALESVGYTKERIAGIQYKEVFPGHFTAVDPMQAKAMIDAGARYLYSTVTEPAHVHGILTSGQKSSVQRYKDGLIIDGMSTNADFSTGGGSGVFTRLVTQNAIYDDKAWAGRTYKIVQNATEQLSRTDFHGWDGDFYGKRWDLSTQTNFGVDLVKKIDEGGGYKDYNELIFTAGNRPGLIDRVVATSESDRQTLIKHLQEQNYTPHNGMKLEDFVVMSPKFMILGPSPHADVKDLKKFAEEAMTEATTGNVGKLQWLLFEGPIGKERATLEEKLLGEGPKVAQDVLLKAAKRTGTFAMTGAQVDNVINQLSSGSAEPKAVLDRLTSEVGEALFRSGSDKAFGLLVAKKPAPSNSSWNPPYGISDESFVRIYEDLASKQKPGQPKSKALELALDVRAEYLLNQAHAGFKSFLEKHPLVTPANPTAWAAEKIASIKGGGAGKAELAMFQAQLSDKAAVGALQRQLIEADSPATLELLKSSIKMHGQVHLAGDVLAKALQAMPATSQTRSHLLASAPAALLKTADPTLLSMLQEQFKGGYNANMGIYGGDEWAKIIDAQMLVTGGKVTDVVRTTIEIGAQNLVAQPAFKEKLAKLEGLYEVGADPKAFAEQATKEMTAPAAGYAKLAWMILGPKASELKLPALAAILGASDYQAQNVLAYVQNPPGKFPATGDELKGLVKMFSDKTSDAALTKLLGSAGRDVLATADKPTLDVLKEWAKDKPNAMGSMGLGGGNVSSLLTELEGKTGDQALVREFVLQAGAGQLIQSGDATFLNYLSAKNLSFKDIGKDATWAAGVLKQACDNVQYYWTDEYYVKNYPDHAKMPEGAKYLLKAGTDKYDEALLGEITQSVKSWGWSQKMFDHFMELTKDMPDDWKAKLVAAQTGA